MAPGLCGPVLVLDPRAVFQALGPGCGSTGADREVEKDLGAAVAVVWAVYESTFRDACVMEWTLEETTAEVKQRLITVTLG